MDPDLSGEDVELKHHYGGFVAGGVPKPEHLKELVKLVKVKEPFKNTDDPIKFLNKKRQLFQQLHMTGPSYELATYIAFMAMNAPDHEILISRLIEKQGKYTSFDDFMRHFGRELYPNMGTFANAQLRNCKQKQGERIMTFYQRTLDCLKEANRDEDQYVEEFIEKLSNLAIKKALTLMDYGEKGRKMSKVVRHAATLETRLAALDSINKAVKSVATVSSEKGGGGAKAKRKRGGGERERGGKSGGRGGRGGSKEVKGARGGDDQPKARPQGARGGRGGRGGRGRGGGQRGGGRGGGRGGETRGGKEETKGGKKGGNGQRPTQKRSIYTINEEEEDEEYEEEEEKPILTAKDLKTRCANCLSSAHQWNQDNPKCPASCPFCDVAYVSKRRHAAKDCPSLPRTRASILSVVDGI